MKLQQRKVWYNAPFNLCRIGVELRELCSLCIVFTSYLIHFQPTYCALLHLCANSSWMKQWCSMLQTRGRGVKCRLGGLQTLCRPRSCCRRSLQDSAAMVPFDRAEKKVTAGAGFHITLNYLPADFNKHEKDVFSSYSRLQD